MVALTGIELGIVLRVGLLATDRPADRHPGAILAQCLEVLRQMAPDQHCDIPHRVCGRVDRPRFHGEPRWSETEGVTRMLCGPQL